MRVTGSRVKQNNWEGVTTSASPALTKVFVRTRRISLLTIPLTLFTRRVLLDTVGLQKENGLLSVQWAVQLEGFLDKIGLG